MSKQYCCANKFAVRYEIDCSGQEVFLGLFPNRKTAAAESFSSGIAEPITEVATFRPIESESRYSVVQVEWPYMRQPKSLVEAPRLDWSGEYPIADFERFTRERAIEVVASRNRDSLRDNDVDEGLAGMPWSIVIEHGQTVDRLASCRLHIFRIGFAACVVEHPQAMRVLVPTAYEGQKHSLVGQA